MLDDLNPEQQRAVTAGDGHTLVLAGAGSGKTRVLTTRVAYLIRDLAVPPHRVLAFTFTNKAAREMRERVERILGAEGTDCWIGTFHATGVRILRREATRLGWARNFAIYDTADSEAVVKELLASRTLPRHVSPTEVRNRISTWKNDCFTPRQAAEEAGDQVGTLLAALYEAYDKTLRRNNAFDFDDLVGRPVQLFDAEPEVLHRYALRFLHVLVDEFQDTNGIQMRFINQLSSFHKNLFVVGDDDQSIYSWRGARVENILRFDENHADTRTVRLEQNYRSTTPILNAANAVIAHNRSRKGKNLWTARGGDTKLRLRLCFDEEEEGSRATQLVQERVAAGAALGDFAFLYRTNAQSRALEDALRRNNVPYQIVGGTRFYERREVRDVLAYLKAIHNPADEVATLRAIKVPRRGIGDTTVERLRDLSASSGMHIGALLESPGLEIAGAARRRVQEFAMLLRQLRALAASDSCVTVLQTFLEATDYFTYLRDSDPAGFEARRENVEELVSAAQAFVDESDDGSLAAFLEEISLLTDIDSMQERADQVTLMTLHSAKGLEYPIVLLTGLEEGLLPHAISAQTLAELEEERRLLYVGMTRAQNELHLFAAHNRRRFGDFQPMHQSRFLDEIPPECIEIEDSMATAPRRAPWTPRQPSWRSYAEGDPDAFWSAQKLEPANAAEPVLYDDDFSQEPVEFVVGMRVRHPRFGDGIIEHIEGRGEMMKLTVVFGRHDRKKLVARYAKLVPILG